MKILLFSLYTISSLVAEFLLAELLLVSIIGFILTRFNPRSLFFWLLGIASWISAALAYFLNYWACRHLDAEGNLIYLRGWLQPPDMAELWGSDWAESIAGLTKSQAVLMYLKRNPGQGFDQLLRADVTMQTPIKIWWRKGDNYLYTCDNAFHFSCRIGLATGGFGWRLNNIVEGYPHKTMGQIVCTPIRFHK